MLNYTNLGGKCLLDKIMINFLQSKKKRKKGSVTEKKRKLNERSNMRNTCTHEKQQVLCVLVSEML